jgi:hypothetical protein
MKSETDECIDPCYRGGEEKLYWSEVKKHFKVIVACNTRRK